MSPTSRDIQLPSDYYATLDGLRVLVVDDETDTRELVAFTLSRCGAEVKSCTTAEEALSTLEAWEPDVLVSDIGMPGVDGYEFIRRVRELDTGLKGRIPAVALTAYAGVDDHQRALSAGFQMHLAKPLVPNELVAVVATLAGRSIKV
ncbi:MAG: response regulator [Acidobacteria bacterium]|nr:response regulator [Acidobacteriota bacterium]